MENQDYFGNFNNMTFAGLFARMENGVTTARDSVTWRHLMNVLAPDVHLNDNVMAFLKAKWAENKRKELEEEAARAERLFDAQMAKEADQMGVSTLL